MSRLRISILEQDFKSTFYQIDNLTTMLDEYERLLIEAYMDDDASLTKEDAEQMVQDLK